jgi:tRNA modification GTPase
MAGLGAPGSAIEKEGIKRGRRLAAQADGILFVVDGSRPDEREDIALLERYLNKSILFIINKIDKRQRLRADLLRTRFPGIPFVEISALKGTNIDKLRDIIYQTFAPKVGPQDDVLFHLRDKLLLEEALGHLKNASKTLGEGHSEEVVAEEIREMVSAIGRLTGEIRADDVLDNIFGRFCVGK